MKSMANLLILILTLALLNSPIAAKQKTEAKQKATGTSTSTAATATGQTTVKVSATGRESAQPDTAVVSVLVQVSSGTASSALAQNLDISAQLIEQVNTLIGNFPGSSVQTTSFQIYSQTQRCNPNDPISTSSPTSSPTSSSDPSVICSDDSQNTVYQASNYLSVQVRNLNPNNNNIVGKIIDTVTNLPDTSVSGVSFSLSNDASFKQKALQNAVKTATNKVKAIAAAAGLTLQTIIHVSEANPNTYYNFPSRSYGSADGGGALPTSLNIGSVDVSCYVELVALIA